MAKHAMTLANHLKELLERSMNRGAVEIRGSNHLILKLDNRVYSILFDDITKV